VAVLGEVLPHWFRLRMAAPSSASGNPSALVQRLHLSDLHADDSNTRSFNIAIDEQALRSRSRISSLVSLEDQENCHHLVPGQDVFTNPGCSNSDCSDMKHFPPNSGGSTGLSRSSHEILKHVEKVGLFQDSSTQN
jgi:hypothetical protein